MYLATRFVSWPPPFARASSSRSRWSSARSSWCLSLRAACRRTGGLVPLPPPALVTDAEEAWWSAQLELDVPLRAPCAQAAVTGSAKWMLSDSFWRSRCACHAARMRRSARISARMPACRLAAVMPGGAVRGRARGGGELIGWPACIFRVRRDAEDVVMFRRVSPLGLWRLALRALECREQRVHQITLLGQWEAVQSSRRVCLALGWLFGTVATGAERDTP